MAIRFVLLAVFLSSSAFGGLFLWRPTRLECPLLLSHVELLGAPLSPEAARAASVELRARLGEGPEEKRHSYLHVEGSTDGAIARARFQSLVSHPAGRAWLVEGDEPISEVVAKTLLALRAARDLQSPPGLRGWVHSLSSLVRFDRLRDGLPFLERQDELCDGCLGEGYVVFGGEYEPLEVPGPATRFLATNEGLSLKSPVAFDAFVDVPSQKLWFFARP